MRDWLTFNYRRMKRINIHYRRSIILLLFFLYSFNLSAGIKVFCDVAYEKEQGIWSDLYRTKVDFVSGEELGLLIDQNKLFAIIWFSQTNCAVIKTRYQVPLISKVSIYDIYGFFLTDVLNEGLDGFSVNGNQTVHWKLYGKDEASLLIDPVFETYPYNSYNNGIRRNIRNGFINKRAIP